MDNEEKSERKEQFARGSLAIAERRVDELTEWATSAICCREMSPEQRMDGLELVEARNPSQSVRVAVERICQEVPETTESMEATRKDRAMAITKYITGGKVWNQPNAMQLVHNEIERILRISDEYLVQRDAARQTMVDLTRNAERRHEANPEAPYPKNAIDQVKLGRGIGDRYQWPTANQVETMTFAEQVRAANSNLIYTER